MIFSRYAQDPGNLTSWRVRDINFQIFLKPCPWTSMGGLQLRPISIPSFISEKGSSLIIFHNLEGIYIYIERERAQIKQVENSK